MEKLFNNINRILTRRIVLHTFFWFSIYAMLLYFTRGDHEFFEGLFIIALVIFPLAIPVYLHFFILEKLLYRKRNIQYVLLLPVVIAVGVFVHYFVFNTFNYTNSESDSIVSVLIILIITTIIKYSRHNVSIRSKLQEAETDRAKTELQMLKSQVNPHFLFNSLNMVYAVARKNNDEETADIVVKPSELLTFMIYNSNVEYISISKEINYIQKYIDLQKIRFVSSDLKVDLYIDGDIINKPIAPMILIPFVENAFKHGVSINLPSFINININVSDKEVYFYIENSINRNKPFEGKGGLGLENLKKRLAIIYPDKHVLHINKTKHIFKVELKIFHKNA